MGRDQSSEEGVAAAVGVPDPEAAVPSPLIARGGSSSLSIERAEAGDTLAAMGGAKGMPGVYQTLQAQVVAQQKAPTVAAQTERRDRKVVAAVTALAAQKQVGSTARSAFQDGMTVVWKRLEYALPTNPHRPGKILSMLSRRDDEDSYGYRKKIMLNMSGRAEPGNFLAVMGPEGSGKSLLLYMLAGRVRADIDPNCRGSVTYNGLPFTDEWRREIGLFEQDSELEENLTVKETLMYAAQLRLPQDAEEIDRIVRVEHVLDSLELTQVADVVLRSNTSSGGKVALLNEKRRLAIGIQMLVNPPLLLLDEPTSGLDGAMALRLTRALHSYAQAGRTVIAAMKQPSNRMFALFSHLLLVAEGHPLYYGPADTALQHFDSLGYAPSPGSSPAEFFLDLTAPEAPDASIHFGTTTNLLRLWHGSDTAKALDQGLAPPTAAAAKTDPTVKAMQESLSFTNRLPLGEDGNGNKDVEAAAGSSSRKPPKRWVTSWGFQCWVLMKRQLAVHRTQAKNDLVYVSVTSACLLICAVLAGCLWFQLPLTPLGFRDTAGLIFYIQLYWGLVPMLTTVIVFIENRKVVRKELEDGIYHVSAYFAAKTFLYLPWEIIPPILFNLIVYWMAGLNPYAGAFILFTLTLILEAMVASSMGFFIGALSESIQQAIWTALIFQLLNVMFVQFLVLNAPVWISWTQYLSFAAYSFRLLMRINFPGYDQCVVITANNSDCPYFQSQSDLTSEVTRELWELPGGGWLEAAILLVFLVVFRIGALLLLRVRVDTWRRGT